MNIDQYYSRPSGQASTGIPSPSGAVVSAAPSPRPGSSIPRFITDNRKYANGYELGPDSPDYGPGGPQYWKEYDYRQAQIPGTPQPEINMDAMLDRAIQDVYTRHIQAGTYGSALMMQELQRALQEADQRKKIAEDIRTREIAAGGRMTSGGGIDSNGPNPWSTAGVPQSAQAPQPPRRTPTPRNPNPIKGTTPTIGGPGWRLPKL